MSLVADAHVHVYPCHDLALALQSALANLAALGSAAAERDATFAVFLAERRDCHVFEGLAAGRVVCTGWAVAPCPEPAALRLTAAEGTLYVFAGRQIVTRERLEVLALTTDAPLRDGRGLRETVDDVLARGALTVLPWSPGKWLLERGRVLRGLFATLPRETHGGRLLLADSTLRPRGFPAPRLIAQAYALGSSVVAGSDPLPLPGEERIVGSYASRCPGTFDASRPVASARALLARTDAELVGTRRSLPEVLARLWRLRIARRVLAHGGDA